VDPVAEFTCKIPDQGCFTYTFCTYNAKWFIAGEIVAQKSWEHTMNFF
jgi:hypothetical protein